VKIGLDLSILERPCPTGVERAWRCTVEALLRRKGDERWVLYSRGPVDLGVPLPARAQEVVLGGPERPSVWREMRLAPALRQDGVDLLHSPVAAIPLRTSVPRSATVHEIPWIRNPGIEGLGREAVHRIRVRVAAATAALLVVPSEATRADLASLHPAAADRIRVVPHGVDPLFLAPPPAADDAPRLRRLGLAGARWIAAVGAGRPRKDLPALFRAYALYRERGGDRLLAVTGPGRPPGGPPRGTLWLGFLEDADLVAVLRGADALAYHTRNEGFGLPLLEAMALGVPVVAARAGAVPETAGDAALLLPPGDTGAWADAFLRVTSDPATRERLRTAGSERVGRFSFAAAAESLVAAFGEAVAAAKAKRMAAAPPSSKEA
jgi:glycosyltransferase involved in cell wall biosynthesis